MGTGDRRKAVGTPEIVDGGENMVFCCNVVGGDPVAGGLHTQDCEKYGDPDDDQQDHACT